MKTKIAKDLLKIQAVFLRPDEPFIWASGIKSPIYCDNRLILTAPEARNEVEQAIAAYLGALALNPVLMRALFVDILGLGMPGLAARRRANQELADFMLGVVNQPPAGTVLLHSAMAMAVVGGINELVLQAIEQDQVAALADLVAPSSALLRAAVAANYTS